MPQQKPTVFIGSSSEESATLTTVTRLLKPFATVTPWTCGDEFKRIGDYFLDSLITASENFDFAVLIFGPDDLVTSREELYYAPRDNVVFELGLFISKLGRTNTFIIAPRLWRSGLKILSDLQGLNIAEYDPPERKKDLEAHLKKVCKKIGEKMRQIGPAQPPTAPKGVTDVRRPIEDLLVAARTRKPKAHAHIRNIALDMEVTWPLLREMILHPDRPEQLRNITWQSVMIDPKEKEIQRHSSDTVSARVARDAEKQIKLFCEQHHGALEERGIKFECKAYGQLPIMHGFMFNNEVLFFSLCNVKRGRLVGSPTPYIEMSTSRAKPSDRTSKYFLEAFNGWFEYYWEHGRKIWPSGEHDL
jgi:hypothetical protein